MPRERSPSAAGGLTPRLSIARRRGAVMVIVLLGLVLLVALVLFVLNLGQQVNRRTEAQNVADASGVAGATAVARTLNTVARNNINLARGVALVNVLDSLPQAVDFTRREQTAFRDALDAQLARGVDRAGPSVLSRELEDMLRAYRDELNEELDEIIPVDEMLQPFDMEAITHYRSPEGRGRLWRAMAASDRLSRVLLDELGPFAQTTAVSGANVNHTPGVDGAGFMTPITPTLPWRRGNFDDLERPVRHGLLPEVSDDPVTRRGPFDTVFGWRDLIGAWSGGYYQPGESDVASPGRGDVPIGSGSGGGDGGRRVGGEWEYTGYRTYGVQPWLLERIDHFRYHHLRNTRLQWWMRRLANAKLDYLWPGGGDPTDPGDDDDDDDAEELDRIVEPDWEIDWHEATDLATAEPDRIAETGFIAVEIKSRYPIGDGRFMSPGSWAPVTDNDRRQPRLVRVSGWEDPRGWGVPQIADHGWRDAWEYGVYFDQDIGIDVAYDASGDPIVQPVYRIDHFYFAGVNLGEPVDIGSPYEGFDPDAADAPAPIDFDHTQVTMEPDSRRRYLTFLGVARRTDRAQSWPSRFTGGKPYPHSVALAQVKVFNNHSWDLWTPMWRAQLEPIENMEEWAGRMDPAVVDLTGGQVIDPGESEVSALHEYLTNTLPLTEWMMEH